MYAAGPGDIVNTFRAWNSGADDSHQVAVTYSGQFFQLCKELGVKGVAVSSNPRVDSVGTEQFVIENRPKKSVSGGMSYHLQQVSYAKGLIETAKREGADILVAAESTGHLFALGWFAPSHLALVLTLHCTLWPQFSPLTRRQRFLNLFNRRLFCKQALAILCISEAIRRQLQVIGGEQIKPVLRFRPCYRRKTFETVAQPVYEREPFSLLFAGRLEENKGIFDLVEIGKKLRNTLQKKVVFDIAGDGSEEKRFKQVVAENGLDDVLHIHGYCHRQKMLDLIEKSHAFIVPTRSEFEEGFNKVVAEAVLNNRPVVTSAVCPAIEDVRPAVVEARPNTIEDYCQGISRLVMDAEFYQEKLAACQVVQEQFYEQRNSWYSQLKEVVEGGL